MMGRSSVSIVVPAFDEAARLPRTLDELLRFAGAAHRPMEIIVVDDGSRDETSAIVRQRAARHRELRLIRLPHNRGKGFAVRAGVVNATGELVLFCDADGATPMTEFARLERAVDEGAAIAIGSRALQGEETHVTATIFRRVIGRTFHQLVRGFAVRGIRDTQCGFKLFRGAVAQDLFSRMRMDRYSFDVELLMMAQRRGYRIAEVPVNWTHQPGSKINVVRDGLRMALDVLRLRWNVARGRYDEPHIAIDARAA